MTRDMVDLYGAIRLYSVELMGLDGREIRPIRSKLQRYGVIIDEQYTWSTDTKNRPTRKYARYTVIVPREKNQSFTAMMTQTKKQLASIMTFHRLP